MSLKTTEAKLYYALYDFFEAEGFRLLMDKKQFRKNTPAGFTNIIFSVSEYEKENDAWIEVHIGCRNDQVEQIAQQFLNANLVDFRSDVNTIIISTGKYNDVNYFRYKIQNDDDLTDACESIKEFMQLSGFGFLASITHVGDIDRILNLMPKSRLNTSIIRYIAVLKELWPPNSTTARNLTDLLKYTEIYLLKFGNDVERANYERLVAYLQYYGNN